MLEFIRSQKNNKEWGQECWRSKLVFLERKELGAVTKDLASYTDGRLWRQNSNKNSSCVLKGPGCICWSLLHLILPHEFTPWAIQSACFPTQLGQSGYLLHLLLEHPQAASGTSPPSTCNKLMTQSKRTAFCEAPVDMAMWTKKGHQMSLWPNETYIWWGSPLGRARENMGPGHPKDF